MDKAIQDTICSAERALETRDVITWVSLFGDEITGQIDLLDET